MYLGDKRHTKTVNAMTFTVRDIYPQQFTAALYNELGHTVSFTSTATAGTSGGRSLRIVAPIKLNGLIFGLKITCPADKGLILEEFSLIFQPGGEYR